MTNAQSKEEQISEFDHILALIQAEGAKLTEHLLKDAENLEKARFKSLQVFKRLSKLEQQCSDIHVVSETESEQSEYDEEDDEVSEEISEDDDINDIYDSPKRTTAAFSYEDFDKERFTQPADDFSEDFTQIDAIDESQINEKKRKRSEDSIE